MSEWPVDVVRSLTASEALQVALALSARLAALGSAATDAREAIVALQVALDEGRLVVEVEDEPEMSPEEAAEWRRTMNDDGWEAAKEGRL